MNLHEVFSAANLDRKSVPQSSLDITERVRTNPFPWTGQFSPQFVEHLLANYASESAVVLDPFAGSGTSLVEAARLRISVIGCDINIAAVILSRVYGIANIDKNRREKTLVEFRKLLDGVIAPPHGPLFSNGSSGREGRAELESGLLRLWHDSPSDTIQDLAAALIVLCDFHRSALDAATVHKTWRRIEETVSNLPYSAKPIVMHHADARDLPVDTNSVDMVLTSPPYINVLNYHQKYRRSVESMGWDVLANAPSEIGSNRQNRGNRFRTVIQYSLDMALALREMVRVSKPGARLILVLGRESRVRGERFFNGELVSEIAVRSVGIKMDRRQERVFRNRYGNNIYEDILHFCSKGEVPDRSLVLKKAKRIAGTTLSATRSSLPDDVRLDIKDALDRLDTINPSPMMVSDLPVRIRD